MAEMQKFQNYTLLLKKGQTTKKQLSRWINIQKEPLILQIMLKSLV